jgi:hypothetical protein
MQDYENKFTELLAAKDALETKLQEGRLPFCTFWAYAGNL